MAFQVSGNQRVEQHAVFNLKISTSDHMIRKRSRLVARPRLKRGHKLTLIDQAVLKPE
jgi:hypothetical protein